MDPPAPVIDVLNSVTLLLPSLSLPPSLSPTPLIEDKIFSSEV